jgi:hypothetical protein
MVFRNPPIEGNYKSVALGFFDILGFKNFLEKNCKDSPNFLLSLIGTADFFTSADFSVKVERRIVSDSIIIWTEDLNQGLLAICNIASLLQSALLKKGCLIRGGIVLGKHFSENVSQFDPQTRLTTKTSDEIIVSPALARAVELEKKILLPEIIFENNPILLDQLSHARSSLPRFQVHIKDALSRPSVEGWFTSHELLGLSHGHLPYLLEGTTSKKMEEACKAQALIELKEIRQHIVVGLGERHESVKTKWQHIAKKYNNFISSCPSAPELVSFEIKLDA